MKRTRFATKALLLLLVTILLTGAVAVTTLAADREYPYENQYGQIIPTDSKLDAPRKSYSFSGDKAELYFMRISEGKKNAHFAIEIFSDKAYTDPIRSLSGEFDAEAGSKALKITWDFKSTPSGTYYGKSYAYVERSDGIVIDSDSVRTFTIKIDRIGKKTVKLNSISNTASGVKLTWTPLVTGTKYVVLRKGPGDEKWVKIQTLGKGANAFTDKTVKSGKKYTYTVKCYDGDYKSLSDKNGLSITYLSTPALSKVGTSTSAGYAKLSWSKVSGAKGYYVYRKGGSLSNSTWKKIATIKSGKTVSYIDKTAKSTDWKYTYSVKAYNGKTVSSFDKSGVDFNYIKAPVLKKAVSYENGVKITWADPNSLVTHYYVYRKASGETSWTKIGKAEGKTFVDTTAKSGKTYSYTIKPAAKTNSGAYNSKGIATKFLSMPQLKSVDFDDSQRTKLSWGKVSGAKGYKVYRKITGEKKWTKIADITKGTTVSYIDTVKKESGKTYIYTVKAFNGDYVSYYNTSGIRKMFLTAPSVKLANKTSDEVKVGVNVSWKAVSGAESYRVYRRTADSSWVKIADGIKELSFYDTAAESATAYEYAVKAVNGKSASKYNEIKIIALEKPVIENVVLTEEGISLSWSQVPGADTYYVLRKAPEDKEWTAIGSYSLNSYVDSSEEAFTNGFIYTVAAEAEGYRGDYDKIGVKSYAEIVDLKAEFIPASEENAPYIIVNWAYSGDYDYIELYKSTAGEESVLIDVYENGEEQTVQFIDDDLAIGTAYTYFIKTVKEGKVATVKSVDCKYPHNPIEAVEFSAEGVFDEDGSYIKIDFSAVEFAEGYEIYKRAAKDSEWTMIKAFATDELVDEKGSYIDYDIDEEAIYYYIVKGVASDRDSLYDENGKNAAALRPIPPVAGIIVNEATVLTEDVEKTVARISWDAVEGINIQKYDILRKTEGGEWEIIDFIFPDTTVTSYDDETIEQGVLYTYTVVAIEGGRTSLINEIGADFIWEFPEEPTDPEEPENPTFDTNNPLGAYQQAVLNIRENGAAGYTKKTWNTLSKSLESDEISNLMLPIVEAELEDSLITETEAEAIDYQKGSDDAANNMPASNCSAEKVKSATVERSGDNYVITIVMLDQTNCSKADTDGLSVMSNDLIFTEEQDCEVVYKEYTITATMTADGQFVEIKHYCNTDITAEFDLTGASGTGYYGLEFETVYSDFVY